MPEDSVQDATILIVDDQQANVTLLERQLRRAGYRRLVSTTAPQAALPLYLAHAPDLVVLDLMMPELDGFSVLAQLQARTLPDSYLPILVLTADMGDETKRRALAAGARDFLTKPVDMVELQLRLRNLLEIRFLQRALQQRIARDLHDGPLQDLGVLLLTIEQCRRQIAAGAAEAALASLARLRTDLRASVTGLRGVVQDLRPPVLDSEGLRGGLEYLVGRLRRDTDLAVDVENHLEGRLDPGVETLVFRLVQEALNNIRQHAQARHVAILLARSGDTLQITVRDDGRGFVVPDRRRDALLTGHIGLAGMYERTTAAGGQLQVESRPGAGTRIEAVLPLRVVGSQEDPRGAEVPWAGRQDRTRTADGPGSCRRSPRPGRGSRKGTLE